MSADIIITSPLWGGRKSEAFSGGGMPVTRMAPHPKNSSLRFEFCRPPHKGEAMCADAGMFV